MNNNYMHVCFASEKCKCGWTGCICETKYSTEKISDKESKIHRLCPKCNEIVSAGTQTTS